MAAEIRLYTPGRVSAGIEDEVNPNLMQCKISNLVTALEINSFLNRTRGLFCSNSGRTPNDWNQVPGP